MAPISGRRAALATLVGIAGTVALHYGKPLPWSLAAIVGLAMAVLAVYALRTVDQLRRIWRRDRQNDG